jgi:peptide-methionine (S)-S-oxide reductase
MDKLTSILAVAVTVAIGAEASAKAGGPRETAVFAGGCFWGVEAVFEHVRGVETVHSGYAGGRRTMTPGPAHRRTGYAEAVRVQYDPSRVSYARLLEIFLKIAHDPTQLNRQGPDVGIQYRSAIFPQSPMQRQTAERMLETLRIPGRPRRVTTRIETGSFELAAAEHQDFVRRNPRSAYVKANDLPKLEALKRSYPELWRP